MEQDLLHVKGQKERQAGARALLPVLLTPPLTSDRSLGLTVSLWFSLNWRHSELPELLFQGGGSEFTCTRADDQVKSLFWRCQKPLLGKPRASQTAQLNS